MNVPLVLAGLLAILGAAFHGVGGEVVVVAKDVAGNAAVYSLRWSADRP